MLTPPFRFLPLRAARTAAAALSMAVGRGGCAATFAASTGEPVYVYQEPPPPPAHVVVNPPPRPYRGAVWVRGHWRWTGHRYVWVRGHYVRPRAGHVYVQPRWEHRGNRWVYVEGRWRDAPRHRGTVRAQPNRGGRRDVQRRDVRVRDRRDEPARRQPSRGAVRVQGDRGGSPARSQGSRSSGAVRAQ